MCMACDLLQGVELDAAAGDAQAVRDPVHLPSSRDAVPLARLFPAFGVPLHGRVRRCPPARGNGHATASPRAPTELVAAAIEDFRHFWQGKLEGIIDAPLRYLVALPTPFTQLQAAAPGDPDPQAWQALQQQCLQSLQALLQDIPPEQLAIQWDAPAELRLWETRGRDLTAPRGVPERVLEQFVRLYEALPSTVHTGLHLCQGPAGPSGASSLAQAVRLAGAVIASTEREPGWLHFSVPAEATDPEWYAPLANLQLWPAMEVHVGVVQADCGATEAVNRLAAAQAVLPWAAASLACTADPVQALPVLQRL